MALLESQWDSPTWWRDAVVYQIYPRSFADANGDGVGDLKGVTSRVGYLSWLGVDAVWLSPFYPSALADGGYDVDDYRDVDPQLGTLADFSEMVEALHKAGIKVLVDIVPNHSSNRHPWFQTALASPPGSPERDRYIFRRGLGENADQPPSDWQSAFGGPAWSPVGDGWYYFHLFAPEQPDWNWQNQQVRDDFLTTLRFWSDRGVDGFRVDVAMGLAKGFGADFPAALPSKAELEATTIGPNHLLYDRDEVDEIYHQWRSVFNEYNPPRVGVAELWNERSDRKARYASQDSLGQAFFFDIVNAGFSATKVQAVIEEVLGWTKRWGSAATWVLSNHDIIRHASRFGLPDLDSDDLWANLDAQRRWLLTHGCNPVEDTAKGLRRARALSVFLMALPGSLYIYQGEELGLREVADLPDESRLDPIYFASPDFNLGRDGCRVPLPWNAEPGTYGFSTDSARQGDASAPVKTYLPQPAWFAQYGVAGQQGDPGSTLNLYRQALGWRHQLQPSDQIDWVQSPPGTLHIKHPNGWHAVINFMAEPVDWPGLATNNVILSTQQPNGQVLPGEATVWYLDTNLVGSPASG